MDVVGSVNGKTCIIVEGNLHIIYINSLTTKNIDMLTEAEAFCISASYLKRAGAKRHGFWESSRIENLADEFSDIEVKPWKNYCDGDAWHFCW